MAMNFERIRGKLSAPRLLSVVRKAFGGIGDHRKDSNKRASMPDALMSALAMFSLKFPSLLKFDEAREEEHIRHNLHHLYGVEWAPSDSQMRDILDPVPPSAIHPAYREIFAIIKKTNILEKFHFLGNSILVSIDGTGQFSSSKVCCPECATKTTRSGETQYYHQLLGAVIVHPNQRQVIPLIPEPILRADGDTKNDCERNAAKRLLIRLKEDEPESSFIVVEDALAANGPHINLLNELGFSYIIGVKEGDHTHLFEAVDMHEENETMGGLTQYDEKNKVLRVYRFVNDLSLNKSHPDLMVNFLEYFELKNGKVRCRFTWVTDLVITEENCVAIARGGRSRWKIENETFNALKNQGYHLEHNYGHGKQHLATNFALLTMLAFLIDQVQESADLQFQKARQRFRSRTSLWERMRSLFVGFFITGWDTFWQAIIHGHHVPKLVPKLEPKRDIVPNNTS